MRLSLLLFTGLAACQISDQNPALQLVKAITGGTPKPSTAQGLVTSIQGIAASAKNLNYRTTALDITATAPAAQTWQTANTNLIAAFGAATANATSLPAQLSPSDSQAVYAAFGDMVGAFAEAMQAYVAKGAMGVYNGQKMDYLVQEKVGAANFVQALGEKIPTADGAKYSVLAKRLVAGVDAAIQAWKADASRRPSGSG